MTAAKSICTVPSARDVDEFRVAAETNRPAIPLPSISIIVPVLNEVGLIAPFLRHLRERAPDAELIAADGGSRDGTRQIAEPLCDKLVASGPGRARQLNSGARAANGDVLWFLHVDSEVPSRCLEEIRHVLANGKAAGGYFRIRLPSRRVVYRFTDCFAHYAGLVLRIRCGDHGLFCWRNAFFQSGGFPDVPLMEDVEFFRRLHRFGHVRPVRERLATSLRRYEQLGPLRVTCAYGLIASLYAFGVPLRALAAIYARTCEPSRS